MYFYHTCTHTHECTQLGTFISPSLTARLPFCREHAEENYALSLCSNIFPLGPVRALPEGRKMDRRGR